MATIKDLEIKHRKETQEFIDACLHTDVKVEDSSIGFRQRDITLRCGRCGLNLLTYVIDGDWSYLSYIRDCVNGHPHSRNNP